MSTPKRYRKKPVEIDAMQWTGDNYEEMCCFAWRPSDSHKGAVVDLFVSIDSNVAEDIHIRDLEGMRERGCTALLFVDANCEWLGIRDGEWVAKDRHGFYPIKPDVFAATYEELEP